MHATAHHGKIFMTYDYNEFYVLPCTTSKHTTPFQTAGASSYQKPDTASIGIDI